MVLVQVLQLFTEDVNCRLLHLSVLILGELSEDNSLLSGRRKSDEEVFLVVLPESHKLEGGTRDNAQILTHEHAGHYNIVLPLLI